MNQVMVDKKEEIIMKLIHYFITKENYTPIVVNGVSNEIWLENINGPVKIVRINSNYIHNTEQYGFDVFKMKKIINQIKKKTLSFKMNALNILLNVNDTVKIKEEDIISSTKIYELEDVLLDSKILEIFPNIKESLLQDTEGIDLIINVTKEINEKTEKNNKMYERIFKEKKLLVTPILISISVIMFLITLFLGGLSDHEVLVNLGSVYTPYIKSGEFWRLITGTFLHSTLIHILFNMYALSIIGSQLETYIGKWKFLFVYLVSALGGSLLSVVWSGGHSVGASGAIFGLLGAICYFGYYYRVYFGSVLKSQIIPLIVINLLIGMTVPGIDNAAHIGGLVGGFLAIMAVGLDDRNSKNNMIHGKIVLTMLFGFLIYMIYFI